jgi:alginate O-acetyltransferase complex protein AlgI
MVFNSNIFLFAFLPIVFTLFWTFTTKQQRYALLTVSGYVFYGYWNWNFCWLLLASSMVSFFAGLLMRNSKTQKEKRLWMTAAIVIDLSILGFFKYYTFAIESLRTIFPGLPEPLQVLLPIGISFYTFHTMSYVIDVAVGRVQATKNLWEYLAYVSLFSQLVAGPIVRFRQIEEDLEKIDGPPKYDNMALGIGYFLAGFVKKVVIADSIARYIDPMLAAHTSLSVVGAWLAALGYTFQLYYDFSGYSDMAVGLGFLFGLRIPLNFNAPYKAEGFRDFWRRWHISLSTWLRDYLYIPLGGNRKGDRRTQINLMITMLLGGLWHGASWTFVAWGGIHGLLLSVDRWIEPWFSKMPMLFRRWSTFIVIVLTWVLFRSTSWEMAMSWYGSMFGMNQTGVRSDGPTTLVALVALAFVLVNVLPETHEFKFPRRLRWAVAYAVVFFFAYLFMNSQETVFLYYQF